MKRVLHYGNIPPHFPAWQSGNLANPSVCPRANEPGRGFCDRDAEEAVQRLAYDFGSLRIQKKMLMFMALRAQLMDQATLVFCGGARMPRFCTWAAGWTHTSADCNAPPCLG